MPKTPALSPLTFLIMVTHLVLGPGLVSAQPLCPDPVAETQVDAHFRRIALKQMRLEFGRDHLRVYGTSHSPVGRDMIRVEAYADFRKPGRADLSTMRLTGWVSRCQGTVIVRGNTWLADGTLDVPRYGGSDLPGSGIVLGPDSAPTHVIAFVDSRCPQCHRLIAYGRELAEQGEMRLELRQIAFLETPEEAVHDTRLSETELIQGQTAQTDTPDYLDMLGGLHNESDLDKGSEHFARATTLIETNTLTARKILHLTATPGVLLLDDKSNGGYRLTSYWEMNRLFQPDL